jgi:spoIIIJ-associated protein
MQSNRVTSETISAAVKSYMAENNLALADLSTNLVSEKIFTDKKEYTLEFFTRTRSARPAPHESDPADVEFAKSTLESLLKLMYFSAFEITVAKEENVHVLRVNARDKDGLLIGKNGQNILALQYLMSMIMDRNLKRHVPLVIDVDSYREKRAAYLRTLAGTLCEKAVASNMEVLTEYMPPYERKIMHEEISARDGLATFSVGRGVYKKVVITPLL